MILYPFGYTVDLATIEHSGTFDGTLCATEVRKFMGVSHCPYKPSAEVTMLSLGRFIVTPGGWRGDLIIGVYQVNLLLSRLRSMNPFA